MSKTLILDIDGTLVDSNDAHARAWVQAFKTQHLELSFEQVRPLIGMGGDQVIPALSGIQEEDPRFQALSQAWENAFKDELPQLRPFAGTRALVQAARQAGWQLVVATSGEAELAEKLLQLAEVADLLPQRVSHQDVQASKPQPDLMHAALAKVGAAAQDAWMLGDTRFDVEAAHKAGIRCAFVRLGGNPDPAAADAVYDDLEQAQALLRP